MITRTNTRVIIERSAEQATVFAATLFKTIVCDAVEREGAANLALAGGTTPHNLYRILAAGAAVGEVPWESTEIFFGDERDVPHDHVESNYYMAQKTLLDHIPVEPWRVHPMRADAEDIELAAHEYEQTVRQIVAPDQHGAPRFTLILLGMGADGHTASLFPDSHEALNEPRKLVVGHFVPVLGRKRITFTFPMINAAQHVLLLVTGQDKADAVSRLLSEDEEVRSSIPASRVGPHDGMLTIVLDEAAAGAVR
ncbi:MAG: 6-phosphogluconolactonase [Planctomycetes bacterium]|jgi:6-phosphogluconolactonase|nr:6-phosphogluconolactonase [Planctomycetota bacterium]